MECGRNDNGIYNRSELNLDDDINGLYNEIIIKDVVLRWFLYIYLVILSVCKIVYKYGCSVYVLCLGGFRVRYGFLVS